MRELLKPTVRLHAGWLEAHTEWGPGFHEDGFGLQPTDEIDSAVGFANWVQRLSDQPAGERRDGPNDVRCLYRWIVENDRVLGGIALRYGTGEMLQRLGNVGYGIRPSARGQGAASWALGQMIAEASALGLRRLLIVCEVSNHVSAKTIERHGGVLEADAGPGPDDVRRYWIDTGVAAAS